MCNSRLPTVPIPSPSIQRLNFFWIKTESGIVADCVRDGQRQAVSVLDLPLPEPPPEGAQWIAAYRHWARFA